ncbi:MAG: cytochrome c3 family protein [Gemmatimonadota bacterium]|nr:cytochrome c3 family protein [Gemmatimonadota bacterium]
MSRLRQFLLVASSLAAIAVAALTVPVALLAQDNIAVTKHNFSTLSGRNAAFTDISAGVADYGEICVYCHTPHGGQTGAPLWNRAFGAGPYQMYTSPTIDMVINAVPGDVSLACLSCHDGTIGIDVITNRPNSSAAASIGSTMGVLFPSGPDALKNLGTDLRNDHPIGVTFSTLDAAFNTQASISAAGLKFYGATVDRVECATCHNPHSSTNIPFLRRSNAASALCLTCHIK